MIRLALVGAAIFSLSFVLFGFFFDGYRAHPQTTPCPPTWDGGTHRDPPLEEEWLGEELEAR